MKITQKKLTKVGNQEPQHGIWVREYSKLEFNNLATILTRKKNCPESVPLEVIHENLVPTKSPVTPEILLYSTSKEPEQLWYRRIYCENFSLSAALVHLEIDLIVDLGLSKTARRRYQTVKCTQNRCTNVLHDKTRIKKIENFRRFEVGFDPRTSRIGRFFHKEIRKHCVNRESNPDLALGKRQC